MCNRTDCAGTWAGPMACRVCEEGNMKILVAFRFADSGKGRPKVGNYELCQVPHVGERVSFDGGNSYLVSAVNWSLYPDSDVQRATVFLVGEFQ